MTRPSADVTTTFGIAAIVAALCSAVVIVALHSPSAAVIAALFSGGVALVGVLERPMVRNLSVSAEGPVAVQAPAVAVATIPERTP